MMLEIEAKFLLSDFAPVRTALAAHGFSCAKPRTLMRRRTFVLNEKQGGSRDEWARVRDEGDKVTMTYKHHFEANSALGTEEIELVVDSFDAAVAYMEKLGFRNMLQQENYREAWRKDGVEVTLDEWPVIGGFVEVEGPDEQIVKDTCTNLGFDYATALFGGVGVLYHAKYGKDMGLVPVLTFDREKEVAKELNA